MFSAKYDKHDEDDKVLDELELYNNLISSQKSTQSNINKNFDRSQFEHHIQNQESKNYSKTIYFCKTTELNGLRFVRIPLRSSTTLNIEINDYHYLIWSIPTHLRNRADSENGQATRVPNYRLRFDGLNF